MLVILVKLRLLQTLPLQEEVRRQVLQVDQYREDMALQALQVQVLQAVAVAALGVAGVFRP